MGFLNSKYNVFRFLKPSKKQEAVESVTSPEAKPAPKIMLGKLPEKSRINANNLIRKELGLREIQDSWRFYGKALSEEKWKQNSSVSQVKKVVFGEDDQIEWEEDYYDFEADDGSGESLTIGYYYAPVSKYYIHYTGENPEYRNLLEAYSEGTEDFEGMYKAADMILESRGMSRL